MSKTPFVFFLVVSLTAGAGASLLHSSAPTDQPQTPSTSKVSLADKGNETPLSDLHDGQRAITVKTMTSPSLAKPGNKVDILGIMPDSKTPNLMMSKIMLQNVLVVAVETSKAPDQLLITLAISPVDCEKLYHVVSQGPFTLIWRKPGDDKLVKTVGAVSAFGRGNTEIELKPE